MTAAHTSPTKSQMIAAPTDPGANSRGGLFRSGLHNALAQSSRAAA